MCKPAHKYPTQRATVNSYAGSFTRLPAPPDVQVDKREEEWLLTYWLNPGITVRLRIHHSSYRVAPDELVSAAADFDVVTASLVQSANGAVLDADALRRTVAGADTLTVIDITQALGWKRVDVGWADVTVSAVYKWLLAPRGTAWMSLSDRVSRIMTPHAANWYAGEDPWLTIYGLPLRLAESARRFDASPTWFSALGAGLTLPWLASLDGAEIEAHTVGLANRVCAELVLPQQNSAIVSIPIADAADKLQAAGIRASTRAGAVRVGFHLYNTENDLDRLLDALGG